MIASLLLTLAPTVNPVPVDLALAGLEDIPAQEQLLLDPGPGPQGSYFICIVWECTQGHRGLALTPCGRYEPFEDCADRAAQLAVDEATEHWEETGHPPASFTSCDAE